MSGTISGFGWMSMLAPTTACLILVSMGGTLIASEPSSDGPVKFARMVLNDKYLCDGISSGDFNKDGRMDIVAGPYWYAGPEFRVKTEIYPVGMFWDSKGVPQGEPSNSLFSFVHDFNGDGWSDILVQGRAVQHTPYWYENPKGATGHWRKFQVFDRIWGENPQMLDIDGDGKPEILCNWGGKVGWLRPDPDPFKPWSFTGISEAGPWFNYTHGIGAGDVNGDGRSDLIQPDFWWEQPPRGSGTGAWKSAVTEFRSSSGNGDGGAQMYAYDVDGDGDNDVVTSLDAHGWGLAWYENATVAGRPVWNRHQVMGSRAEEAKYGVAFSQPHAMELSDVDGDGLRDIVVGKRRWAHGPTGDVEPGAAPVVYWFRLTREAGKGAVYRPYLIDDNSGVGLQLAALDVNGDGAVDIMTASKLGAFLFLNLTPPVALIRVHQVGIPMGRRRSLRLEAGPAGTQAWSLLGRVLQDQGRSPAVPPHIGIGGGEARPRP